MNVKQVILDYFNDLAENTYSPSQMRSLDKYYCTEFDEAFLNPIIVLSRKVNPFYWNSREFQGFLDKWVKICIENSELKASLTLVLQDGITDVIDEIETKKGELETLQKVFDRVIKR